MIAFTLDSIPHRVFLVKYNKRKHVRNRKGNFIASHRARHRAALGNSETSVRPPKARACGPLLFSAPVFWLTSFSNFLYTPLLPTRKLPSFHPNISNTAINIYTQLPFSYLRRLQLFFICRRSLLHLTLLALLIGHTLRSIFLSSSSSSSSSPSTHPWMS
jgi:hypothetical protein